jgi:hypothetical protein
MPDNKDKKGAEIPPKQPQQKPTSAGKPQKK